MLSELAARDCRLAVLPEMWSCSFPYPVLRDMAEKTPAILERMRNTARDKRLVIAGSLPEAREETIFNTSYLIDSTGEIAGKYRKIHLFSLYNEQKHFGEGRSAEVFSTSIGKIGLMICYDLRFPELARKLAIEGAEIICVSSLWPLVRIDHWSLLLRARAVENQLFVIGCNGCGAEKKITWGGASAIISPMGSALAEAGQSRAVHSRGTRRKRNNRIPQDHPLLRGPCPGSVRRFRRPRNSLLNLLSSFRLRVIMPPLTFEFARAFLL